MCLRNFGPNILRVWFKLRNEDLLISNFSRPYRKDRIGRPGGGVAIYIKQGFHSVPRSDLINGDIEAICVEIILKTINS